MRGASGGPRGIAPGFEESMTMLPDAAGPTRTVSVGSSSSAAKRGVPPSKTSPPSRAGSGPGTMRCARPVGCRSDDSTTSASSSAGR